MKLAAHRLFALVVILIILFTACTGTENEDNSAAEATFSQDQTQAEYTTFHENGEEMKETNLVVNGVNVPTAHSITIHTDERYAELPLVTIMEALGATVEWLDSHNAVITYNQTVYALNAMDNSLCEVGKVTNYIALPPGTTHGGCYRLEDQEFYVDSDSIIYFLSKLKLALSISYAECTVHIDDKG